jgi:hypothetical protein
MRDGRPALLAIKGSKPLQYDLISRKRVLCRRAEAIMANTEQLRD